MPTKTAQTLGGKASAIKQRKKAIEKYYKSPKFCLECNSIIEVGEQKVAQVKRKKFCSHSCYCIYSNKTRIRAKKEKPKKALQIDTIGLTTKGSLFNKAVSFGDNFWQRARACITKHARRVAKKNSLIDFCKVCGYRNHVEVCHIKAVKDFPDTATLNEINNPNNLIGLCPNHHWEFDHNKLVL